MTNKHDDDLLEKIRRAVKLRNDAMTTFEASKETLTSRTKEIGALLIEARKGKTVKEFDAFLKKAELYSLPWAYEAMALAGGRKTVEQSRADAAERQRESRERKKQREIEAAAAKALPKPEPESEKVSVTSQKSDDDGEAMKAKMAALDAVNGPGVTNKPEPGPAVDAPADDPLVIEITRDGGLEWIEASPWFVSKIKPIFDGTVKNDPAKSAAAFAQFRHACATLLPQMTVNDLQAAQNILSVVGDTGTDAIDAAAKAKRIKAEAKNPEKTKDKARKAAQAFYMEYDMEEAKAESRESGEPWSEQKEEWIAEWIANNWDAEREAKFAEEFRVQWERDHGTEFPSHGNAEQKEAA